MKMEINLEKLSPEVRKIVDKVRAERDLAERRYLGPKLLAGFKEEYGREPELYEIGPWCRSAKGRKLTQRLLQEM